MQADWKEGFKKKQAGVSDMTLLSTISNDSVNENLKKRYVCPSPSVECTTDIAVPRCAGSRTQKST